MCRIRTARLTATPSRAEDAQFLHELWTNTQVMTYLGGVRSRAQINHALNQSILEWRLRGSGRWVVRDATGPVGMVKLSRCQVLGRSEIELGYAFIPDVWGRGYATEIGTDVLDFARHTLGLNQVVAFALLANSGSFGVMRRLGFQLEARFERPIGVHELQRRLLQIP